MPDTAIAALVFSLTYAAIVSERVHKTAAALAGAAVMIAVKIEGYDQGKAFAAIDFNVIFLLVGMMVIVNVLSETGVFQWLAIRSAKMGRGQPMRILIILSLVTAVLSAFLDNVTTVVLIAPVTVYLAATLEVSAVPFLISEALASNIGGTATLIGDPPNIIIGSAAGLDFVAFLVNVAPIVIIILAVYFVLVAWLLRRQLPERDDLRTRVLALDETNMIGDYPLLGLSLGVLGLTLLGFMLQGPLDYEPGTVALLGAAAILVLSRRDPHYILREVEWSTVFFFIGLFIVVGGLETVGVLSDLGEAIADLTEGSETAAALSVLWLSALFSGIVDNVPYTTAMVPVIRELGMSFGGDGGSGNVLWWALSLGACLGGNVTIVAASANVLVAHIAERAGQRIRFWEFFAYGSLLTLVSMSICSVYLWLRYLL